MLNTVNIINKLRLENNNGWYLYNTTINNHNIQIKGYGTWLQIFKIDGIDNGSTMDLNVTQFKEHLTNALSPLFI